MGKKTNNTTLEQVMQPILTHLRNAGQLDAFLAAEGNAQEQHSIIVQVVPTETYDDIIKSLVEEGQPPRLNMLHLTDMVADGYDDLLGQAAHHGRGVVAGHVSPEWENMGTPLVEETIAHQLGRRGRVALLKAETDDERLAVLEGAFIDKKGIDMNRLLDAVNQAEATSGKRTGSWADQHDPANRRATKASGLLD